MAIYAYIRVSTDNKGQTTDNQRKLIEDAGFAVNEFFSEDGVSGSIRAEERKEFSKMMSKLKAGDTIILTMVDRLGRSASDILGVVERLKKMDVKLRVMQFDGIDITSPMGKMILTCMAAMAELERNLLIERTVAGLSRTKAQGTKLGRSMVVSPDTLRTILGAKAQGKSIDKVSGELGVSRATAFRLVKDWSGNMEGYEAEWNTRQAQYAKGA
jgi:DNA invertase Pin-like site-specific DNA recombinase